MGYINREELRKLAQGMAYNAYGDYLLRLLDEPSLGLNAG
jgi:hypothetical protein